MISYVGGKYRQAEWINSYIPTKLNKYIEVFGGAFWVYLKSDFKVNDVVYNDVNPFMANIFACCTQYNKFLDYITKYEAQDNNLFLNFRDEVVDRFKSNDIEIPDFDLGAKYVYIATQTFSGIINEKAKMVDLRGKYKSKYYSFINRLKDKEIQKKLDKVRVFNLSYDELLAKEDDGNSFIYVDPPYYGTEDLYGFHSFGKENHQNLVEMLKNTNSKWILSYYEFPQLREWFPQTEWNWVRKWYKKASMAQKGKNQSVGTEVLIMNYQLDIMKLFF